MHGTRDQFFAGAAFAVNQDGALGRGDGADRLLQFLHGRAGANDVVERVACGRVALEGKVLPAERKFFQRPFDGQPDFVHQGRDLRM